MEQRALQRGQIGGAGRGGGVGANLAMLLGGVDKTGTRKFAAARAAEHVRTCEYLVGLCMQQFGACIGLQSSGKVGLLQFHLLPQTTHVCHMQS